MNDRKEASHEDRTAPKKLRLAWIACLAIIAVLVITSQQNLDLRHSATYAKGLIENGLSFYRIGDERGYGASNYTPGLYALLSAALSPAFAISRIFGTPSCEALSQSQCVVESVSLKLSTLGLLIFSLYVLSTSLTGKQASTTKQSKLGIKGPKFYKWCISALAMPTIMYSWLLFGAYDGLGTFTGIAGTTLFLSRSHLAITWRVNKDILAAVGIALSTLSVSSKLFPIVIICGLCIAMAEGIWDAIACITIPSLLAGLQIAAVSHLGGKPLSIVSDKLIQGGPFLYGKIPAIGLSLLLTLWVAHKAVKNRTRRLSLGLFYSVSLFAIGFPSFFWHPQWQLYYGASLFLAISFTEINSVQRKILTIVLIIQAVSFGFAVQAWTSNADISMTLASINRVLVPPLSELAGTYRLNLGAMIESSWKIYSLTQLASAGVLMFSLIGDRNKADESLMLSQNNMTAITIPAGVSLLTSWIIMCAIASLLTPGIHIRTGIADGSMTAVGKNAILGSSFKSYKTGKLSDPHLVKLEDNSSIILSIDQHLTHESRIKAGFLRIGNNYNNSKGHLDICIAEQKAADTTQVPSINREECRQLELESTSDNSPTYFEFQGSRLGHWSELKVSTTLKPGTPTPILYLNSSSLPSAILYEETRRIKQGRTK